MSFVSYTYSRYDPATKQYFYTLVDSDFGAVEIAGGFEVEIGVGVAQEYIKRGLNVGRNLALLVLYIHKEEELNISLITRWQNEHCSKHIENWSQCAKERDEHLTKLLALL